MEIDGVRRARALNGVFGQRKNFIWREYVDQTIYVLAQRLLKEPDRYRLVLSVPIPEGGVLEVYKHREGPVASEESAQEELSI